MNNHALSDDFRWGMVGVGKIASQFAQALKAVENSRLHTVVGRNRERTSQFCLDNEVPAYADHLNAILEDPAIDAVYIATPHRSHYQLARECLLAGKPVLCEKPLTVNAGQARQLIELAQQRGVFMMEALWTRFLPIYKDVRHWLSTGRIGAVTSLHSSFGFVAARNPGDRLLNPDLAGGALLDIGIYNLCISQWVFGAQPETHRIRAKLGPTGVDEHDEITLDYPGERSSQFLCSFTQDLENAFIINGRYGSIRIHPGFWGASQATLYTSENADHMQRRETISRPFRANGLEYEIEAAQHCIRAGLLESPDMPLADTLGTMLLMDALRRDIGLKYAFE